MDEGGVGAVLEQAADEIGKQVLVGADGGVDTHRALAARSLVERAAHAVQALELIIVAAGALRHQLDGSERVGVVRGELGVDRRTGFEQRVGAGEIGNVGRLFRCEHRIVGLPIDLRALDLAVPVGAFDKADHQAAIGGARKIAEPADDVFTALLVGLHREAEAGPFRGIAFAAEAFEQGQRQGEAVGLFGVEREVDVVAGGELREFGDHRIKLAMHTLALHGAIGRVQRGEFDRDAVCRFGR